MRRTSRTAEQPTLRLAHALLLLWIVFWVVLGGWTGLTIWQFSELGDTVSNSGEAITSAGEALQTVGAVPVIGDGPGKLGTQISAAGAEIVDRGQEAESRLRQISILVGLAIALIPTSTVAVVSWSLRRVSPQRLLGSGPGSRSEG